jgi:hypothetical protein
MTRNNIASSKDKNNTRRRNNKTKKRGIFKRNDYKSDDGMLTTIWGPSLWHTLHTMSFNYPNQPTLMQKQKYRSFVKNLVYVLPCKYCRINLKSNFKTLPLTMKVMQNRNTFSRYIYKLHECVNRMLGKHSGLTYNDVRERYEHFRARCTQKELKERIFSLEANNRTKKERGCIEPLYGVKSKCVLKIVPQKSKCKTFTMNKTCKKKRIEKY